MEEDKFTIARAKTPEMIHNELYPRRRNKSKRMGRTNRGA